MNLAPALHVARAVHAVVPFAQLRTANLFARLNGGRAATLRRRLFGHEIELHVDRSTTHVRVFLEGEAAIPDAAVLDPHLRRGMTVFDVGANIGYTALFFAERVGRGGEIHAFEPEPENYAELARNVEINGLANVHAVEAAVGAEDGEVVFQAGLNGRIAAPGEATIPTRVCPIVSLDSYVARLPSPRVDFVKMDIEGHELAALRGMTRILSRVVRPALYVEVHPTRMGGDPAGVVDLLQSHYKRITAYGNERPSALERFLGRRHEHEVSIDDVKTYAAERVHHLLCLP